MAACDLPSVGGASLTCRLCSGRTGCSAAWLARVLWVHEVAGSSPASPTVRSSRFRRVQPFSGSLRYRFTPRPAGGRGRASAPESAAPYASFGRAARRQRFARRLAFTRCPILGAQRERPGVVRCVQMLPAPAVMPPLACANLAHVTTSNRSCSVVVLGVAGSNPVTHPHAGVPANRLPGGNRGDVDGVELPARPE
jgi:hypothetical protein